MANEILDPDQAALELGRANRRPLLVGVGAIVAIVLAVVVYLKLGESAVRSSLTSSGYTDVHLSSAGLATWKYEAKKGDATCFGTISRTPFSTSSSEGCTTVTTGD